MITTDATAKTTAAPILAVRYAATGKGVERRRRRTPVWRASATEIATVGKDA